MYGTYTVSNSSTSLTENIERIGNTSTLFRSTYTYYDSYKSTISDASESVGSHYTSTRCSGYFTGSTIDGQYATFSGNDGAILIECDGNISYTQTTINERYGTDNRINGVTYQPLPFNTTQSIIRFQEQVLKTTARTVPIIYVGIYDTNASKNLNTVLFTGEYTTSISSGVTSRQSSFYDYTVSSVTEGQSSSISTSITFTWLVGDTYYYTLSGTHLTGENQTVFTRVTLTNADDLPWEIYTTRGSTNYATTNEAYTKSINTNIIGQASLWYALANNTTLTTGIKHIQVDNSYFSNVTYGPATMWMSSIFINIDSSNIYTDTSRECAENNELNYISTFSIESSNSLSTVASFLKIDNQYWTATSGVSTATWKSSTLTSSSTGSYVNSNRDYPNGTIYQSVTSTVIKDNMFEFSSSTSLVSTRSSISSYTRTTLIDSASVSDSYSITYNKSEDRFYTNQTTSYSYWFGTTALSESTTLLATDSYSSYSTHTIPLESTYTSYDVASTVDGDYYTYETTFYGTLEGVGISENSWVNVAMRALVPFISTSISYGLDAATFFKQTLVSSRFGNQYEYTTESSIISEFSQTARTLWNTKTEESYIERSSTYKDGYSLVTEINEDTLYKFYLESYVSNFISTWFPDIYMLTGTLSFTSSYSGLEYGSHPEYSTALNTSEFGTTARISSLVSSKNWVNVFNTYLADNYAYTYNVSSEWNYNDVYETLSEYSTALATSFKKTYGTGIDYDSYSYTKSSSTNVLTITDDRFSIRNGITNYSTVNVNVTNTVAIYNFSTMATINSYTGSRIYSTSRSTSVIDYTFISDIADFTSTESVISTFTTLNVREQFNNSLSTVVSSTMEQQNDTLVFKSEIATFSTYNASTTYSTISTLEVSYDATTYTEEYNPISYTVSSTTQSTSLVAGTMLRSTSESVIHTQSIEYTPVYTTVDGIYMTTN